MTTIKYFIPSKNIGEPGQWVSANMFTAFEKEGGITIIVEGADKILTPVVVKDWSYIKIETWKGGLRDC